MQNINYYILQVDDQQPVAVKNVTATLFIDRRNTSHTLRLRAIDMCGQEGRELVETLEVESITSQDTTTQPATYHTERSMTPVTAKSHNVGQSEINAAQVLTYNAASLVILSFLMLFMMH